MTITHRLLEQLGEKSFSCASEEGPADVVARENQHQQEERKALKQEYVTSLTTKLYLENLGKEESLWPQLKLAREEEKVARKKKHEVKNQIENTCGDIYTIVESATKEHELLKQKVAQLEEKLKLLQNKKQQLESRHGTNVEGVRSAGVKCEQAIQRLEEELTRQHGQLTSLGTAITDLAGRTSKTVIDRHALSRSEEILQFLVTMNGFTARLLSPNLIQLEFPSSIPQLNTTQLERIQLDEKQLKKGQLDRSQLNNKQQNKSQLNSSQLDRSQLNVTHSNKSQLNASCVGSEVFSLIVSITLRPATQGLPEVEDIKVNVDHFMVEDLVQDASLRGNIPHLVAAIQHRWNTHFPLLAEIDRLNKTHAIDWIQDQCKLRLLVGHCGKMMFTLSVPRDYPRTRGITLHDSCGVNDLDLQDLPGEDATLLDWVVYLENKYSDYDP